MVIIACADTAWGQFADPKGQMLAAGTAHHLLCDALTIPQLFVFAGRIRDGPLFVCRETANEEIEYFFC